MTPINNPSLSWRQKVLKKTRFSRNWDLYLLLIPAVVYFVLFYYWPIYGLQIAFRNFSAGLGILHSRWVGLAHFKTFFSSIYFSVVIRNTIGINVLNLLIGFPMPIVLAMSINEISHKHLKKSLQTITYAPYFLSVTVVVSMIISFLSPQYGIINQFIALLGGEKQYFMIQAEYFKPIFVLSSVWQNMGWGSIIYLAALSGVDPQMYEAATVDGASRMQRILHINLPSIMPTIVILLILESGKMMNVGFEKIFLLQNDLNFDASEVISTYVYRKGILGAQYSFAAAVGLFNSTINFVLVMTVNTISKKIANTSLW